MHGLVETVHILSYNSTSSGDHTLNFLVLANLLDDKRGLHGELTSWHKNESLDLIQLNIYLLHKWDSVGSCLSCSVLGLRDDVLSIQNLGDGFLLDWGWELITHLKDAKLDTGVEVEIFESESLGRCDVISLDAGVKLWLLHVLHLVLVALRVHGSVSISLSSGGGRSRGGLLFILLVDLCLIFFIDFDHCNQM